MTGILVRDGLYRGCGRGADRSYMPSLLLDDDMLSHAAVSETGTPMKY